MYKFSSLIDLAPEVPSLLIPVFIQVGSNVPYVQSMGEFFEIDDFAPFYHADDYPTLPCSKLIEKNIRDSGVIGIRKHDKTIDCLELDGLYSYWDNYKEYIKEFPLLLTQILRVVVGDFASQYDAWKAVANKVFNEKSQIDYWIQSEAALFQNNDKIWRAIGSISSSKKASKNIITPDNGIFESEKLLKILGNPVNYDAPNWENLWFSLLSAMPSDERVFYIAQNWIYYVFASYNRDGSGTEVLCENINHTYYGDNSEGSFLEFLYDFIQDGSIFSEEISIPSIYIVRSFQILIRDYETRAVFLLIIKILDENYFEPKIIRFFATELDKLVRLVDLKDADCIVLERAVRKMEMFSSNEEVKTVIRSSRKAIKSKRS